MRVGSFLNDRLFSKRCLVAVLFISHGLKCFWLLAEALDDSLSKFLGANFLFANTFIKNIVGVNSIFNRTQPRVMNAFCDWRLANVHQHHYGAEQQARWIRKVLARPP